MQGSTGSDWAARSAGTAGRLARAVRARLAAAAGSAGAAAAAAADRAAALAARGRRARGAAAAAWPGAYLRLLTPNAAFLLCQGFGMLVAAALSFAIIPIADSGRERAPAVAALPCADSGGERALALRPAGHVARCLPPLPLPPPPPPAPPPQRKPSTRAAVLAPPAPAVRLSLMLWRSAACTGSGPYGCRASIGMSRFTQLADEHAP